MDLCFQWQGSSGLLDEGELLGADAIINVRFTTSMIAKGATETLAYGTAVKIKTNE